MSLLTLPASSGVRPRLFTYLTAAMAVLAVLYILYLTARWTGYLEDGTPWNADDSFRIVFLGGKTFKVPTSMMRLPAQRSFSLSKGRDQSTLRLAVVWPAMTGFRTETNEANQLSSFGKGSNLVLLDITMASDREQARSRLLPVYKRLANGKEKAGPAGLKILPLSGPKDDLDQIVFEPGNDTNGFFARCRRGRTEQVATCVSQIVLAEGLAIRYRFEQPLLANWGLLERRAVDLVRTLASKGDKGISR